MDFDSAKWLKFKEIALKICTISLKTHLKQERVNRNSMSINDCDHIQFESHNQAPSKAVCMRCPTIRSIKVAEALNAIKKAIESLNPGGLLIVLNPPQSATIQAEGTEADLEESLKLFSKPYQSETSWRGITRLARLAGFLPVKENGLSSDELEILKSMDREIFMRKNYILFKKIDSSVSHLLPKVSLLTAAYRSDFFLRAAASAVSQTYPNFEWIICDEGVDQNFSKIVEAIAKEFPSIKLQYFKNPQPLGALGNILKCMSLATGKYIKFLDDDDFHEENCMADFVSAFEAFEEYVSLVSSSRSLTNNKDEFLYVAGFPLINQTKNSFLLHGPQTISFCLNHAINWIGEPNAAMFRTADVVEGFAEIKTQDYYGHLDFVMWINLLAKGNLFYFATPRVFYRRHPQQTIHNPKYMKIMIPIWYEMVKFAEEKYQILGSFYLKALMRAVEVFESELKRCKQSLSQEDFAELSLKLKAAKSEAADLLNKDQPVLAMNSVIGLEFNFC